MADYYFDLFRPPDVMRVTEKGICNSWRCSSCQKEHPDSFAEAWCCQRIVVIDISAALASRDTGEGEQGT